MLDETPSSHRQFTRRVRRPRRKHFPRSRALAPRDSAVIAANVWFHARLEIDGTTVRVFVHDAAEPVLVVKDLELGDRSGLVGFWGYPGAFANLKVTPRDR